MESIISMHDEIYSIKSRRNKSLPYLTNSLHVRRNSSNNKTNIFSLYFQYFKTMVAQRTLYILGIINLILAGIAILCVAHAEDHPEYFSLVYISISIFIFYMTTIIIIIILQIVEVYQEQQQRNYSSLSTQIPLLKSQITAQSNSIAVENMITKTQAKTHLSRSHTLPLTSSLINPHQTSSTSSSSSTLKDLNQSTSIDSALLPQNLPTFLNIPKNYQSFALTRNDQFSPSYTTITNSDSNSHLSPLIKPIPLKYHVNNENNKQKILEY